MMSLIIILGCSLFVCVAFAYFCIKYSGAKLEEDLSEEIDEDNITLDELLTVNNKTAENIRFTTDMYYGRYYRVKESDET